MDITDMLRYICNKLSNENVKYSFKLEEQYFIKEFVGNSTAYRIYKNNNPTKIFLNEKLIQNISNKQELNDLIEMLSEYI